MLGDSLVGVVASFLDLRVLFRDGLVFLGSFVGVACLWGDEEDIGPFVNVDLVFEGRVRGVEEMVRGPVAFFEKK